MRLNRSERKRVAVVKQAAALIPLGRELPATPMAPQMDDDGEVYYRDFFGDFSRVPEFVTDGHMMLLRAEIDAGIPIRRCEDDFRAKYATEEATRKVWDEVEQREDVRAVFIGVTDSANGCFGFLRDPRSRVMVVNGFKFAFAIRAVRPQVLTVNAAEFEDKHFDWPFSTPLALRRDGRLVGLLMPVRMSARDFTDHDLGGEPVGLAEMLEVRA